MLLPPAELGYGPMADAWIAAWERLAAQDRLDRGSAYSEAGWNRIASQRERRASTQLHAPGSRRGPYLFRHTDQMARRADPERIFQARRDAIRNTLTGSGMSLETAERWCDAWEIEAAGRGLPRDAE